MPRGGLKWKWRRIFASFLALYLFYRFVRFIQVLWLNYSVGSPLDFVEMMSEKDPKKILDDFQKFNAEFVPFNFQPIAIHNENVLSQKRKEFIRHTLQSDIGFIAK